MRPRSYSMGLRNRKTYANANANGISEAETTNNKRLRSTFCIEAIQTRSIARPLCDSRASCILKIGSVCKEFAKTISESKYLSGSFILSLATKSFASVFPKKQECSLIMSCDIVRKRLIRVLFTSVNFNDFSCVLFAGRASIVHNTAREACTMDQQQDDFFRTTSTNLRHTALNGKGLDTRYSAAYMSQTRDKQSFTIPVVAADWHEPMVPQYIMWPSTVRDNGQLDPRCS